MSTDTQAPTTRTSFDGAASMGAMAGIIASLMMGGHAMDSGEQIANMAELVGYGTLLVEHLIFGLVMGLILFMAAKCER